ncbi:hypothetical protein ACJX0J_028444, partial [Zea mays]
FNNISLCLVSISDGSTNKVVDDFLILRMIDVLCPLPKTFLLICKGAQLNLQGCKKINNIYKCEIAYYHWWMYVTMWSCTVSVNMLNTIVDSKWVKAHVK